MNRTIGKLILLLLVVIILVPSPTFADALRGNTFTVLPGATKLFFIELGKTTLPSISNVDSSPILQKPYFTGTVDWVLKWVPDSGEGSVFLSPILARCQASKERSYVTTCVDQFRLVAFDERQTVVSISFIDPRYKFSVGNTVAGIGTDLSIVEKAIGRALTVNEAGNDSKKDCTFVEGIKNCCPRELKNICFNVGYVPISPDVNKITDWVLMKNPVR